MKFKKKINGSCEMQEKVDCILLKTNAFRIILATVHITYLLTYLLTPWCRVLLEKLTGLQLVKKFPAFYGT